MKLTSKIVTAVSDCKDQTAAKSGVSKATEGASGRECDEERAHFSASSVFNFTGLSRC